MRGRRGKVRPAFINIGLNPSATPERLVKNVLNLPSVRDPDPLGPIHKGIGLTLIDPDGHRYGAKAGEKIEKIPIQPRLSLKRILVVEKHNNTHYYPS